VTDSKAPDKIRVVRPYASEEEYIQGDFAWIGRSWIVLPNAAARPVGELLRFEVVLSNGAPVIRGEGSVLGHNAPGGPRPAGLEVKLNRFDARSKTILDRVHALRVAVARSGERSLPPRPKGLPAGASMVPAVSQVSVAPPIRIEVSMPDPMRRPKRKIAPPPNREEILDRLRERAKALASRGGFDYKRAKETR
jgi:molecular chaperone DnaK